MKKFSKFFKKGAIVALTVTMMMSISGCGKAETTTDQAEAGNAEVKASERLRGDFAVTVRKEDVDPAKEYCARKDLDSHVLYVTIPTVDDDLRSLLEEYHMGIVEVYAERKADKLPVYAVEPVASAVYYVFQDSAEEVKISWRDPGDTSPLMAGVHLDSPAYVMKYAVTAIDAETDSTAAAMQIGRLQVEDFTGGEINIDRPENSTFSMASLMVDADAIAAMQTPAAQPQ